MKKEVIKVNDVWVLEVMMAHRTMEYEYSNQHDAEQASRTFRRYPETYRVRVYLESSAPVVYSSEKPRRYEDDTSWY